MNENVLLVNPTEKSNRIEIIDMLRGFALFGVLVANLYLINIPRRNTLTYLNDLNGINQTVSFLVQFFITGKFFGLFSFLFGLGFTLQIDRLKERSTAYKGIYLRRLMILLAIGTLHSIFIWDGDILRLYAIVGFLLFLFRNSSSKKIFRWMMVLWIAFYLLFGFVATKKITESINNKYETTKRTQPANENLERWRNVLNTGTYYEATKVRLEIFASEQSKVTKVISPLLILPFFLLGAYFGRRKLISNYKENQRKYKKLLLFGVLGLILAPFYLFNEQLFPNLNSDAHGFVSRFFELISGPIMVLFWIGVVMSLYANRKLKRIFKFLQPIGQMALTNYLTQSILLTWIFYNYGLGLGNKFTITHLFIFSTCLFILQGFFCKWWLSKFKFGPFEWLWRSLTYWKWQSIKSK